jgi:hypothetical protein
MYIIKLNSQNRTISLKKVVRNITLKQVGRRGEQGIQGETGSQGPAGEQGVPGEGVAPGGVAGQVLTKQSNIDFDTGWETPDVGSLQYKIYVTVGYSDADYITDGVADDVQIQAAITQVAGEGGGVVFIKEGTYNISSTIVFPFDPHVRVMGAAWIKSSTSTVAGTALVSSNALTDMFLCEGNENPTSNADLSHGIQFEDITLDGSGTTTNLIRLVNQDHCVVNRCRLRSATNSIKTEWNSNVDPDETTIPGALFLSNSILSANSGIAVDLQYQTQCWISNSWFAGGGSVDAWINFQSSNKIHITNCEFNTAAHAIRFRDTASFFCGDITVNDSTFAVGGGNKAWTDERTNASSNRISITGNVVSSGTVDTLVGTGNVVVNGNGATLPSLSLLTPLPIASGGTGSSTQNFVGLTGNQTIAGTKTFTSSVVAAGATLSGSTTIQSGIFSPLTLSRISADANAQGFRYIKGRGTVGTPAGVQSGDQVARFMANGYINDGTLPGAAVSEDFITINATENWTAVARGRTLDIRTVATGSTTGASRIFIDGSGNVTISGTLTVNTGASGSFTAQSGEVVTVTNGIVTSIV